MKEAIKLVEKALEILKSEEKKEKVVLSSLKPGETFMIGEHEFIVLEQNYETTNVISKNLMAENVQFDKDTKVMYTVSSSGYPYGNVTLLVNSDGTPKIWKGR